MRFSLLKLAVLLCVVCLLACGQADLFSNSTSSDAAASPDVSPLSDSIKEIKIGVEGPLHLNAGENAQLYIGLFFDSGALMSGFTSKVSDQNILWFSNNADVVKVSSTGVVTAVGPGQTTIKATLLNKTSVIEVVVSRAQLTVTGFKFLQKETRVTTTDSFSLKLNVGLSDGSVFNDITLEELKKKSLDCPLKIQSTDSRVASVLTDGKILPDADGTTSINVACGLVSDFALVTVDVPAIVAPPVITPPGGGAGTSTEKITAIEASIAKTEVAEGDTQALSLKIKFTTGDVVLRSLHFISPEGVAGDVTVNVGNSSVASVNASNLLLTSKNYGTTTLTFSAGTFSQQVILKVKRVSEAPLNYSDHFLSADDVLSVTPGVNGGFGQNLFPQIVYGTPKVGRTHVVSLGSGGVFKAQLKGYAIVDGVGPDFTIFENPITQDGFAPFAERAKVEVSDDGVNYQAFACDAYDPLFAYAGCAGVREVMAMNDPLNFLVSGGDVFDLDDLPQSIDEVNFIRITDLFTCKPGDSTYTSNTGGALCVGPGVQGFDLDAMAILNGAKE